MATLKESFALRARKKKQTRKKKGLAHRWLARPPKPGLASPPATFVRPPGEDKDAGRFPCLP